ncbi:MAG: SAM-dependent methyltransferase [Phycisphaerales bacterium]|nr:SAM-dependent methyltransferase [Phycisphaerales bacterium]
MHNYRTTGAVAPSSRFLARSMVKSMQMTTNQRILEVGAGTGSFTKEILKNLNDGDELHIVELSDDFCKLLEDSILSNFREMNKNIKVVLHNSPIEEADLEGKFDAVICGLPFNNFPVDFVQHLFEVMFGLMKDGAELAYFEYLGMRGMKKIFGTPSIRKETRRRTVDINHRYSTMGGSTRIVWRNLPSCRVVRLKQC